MILSQFDSFSCQDEFISTRIKAQNKNNLFEIFSCVARILKCLRNWLKNIFNLSIKECVVVNKDVTKYFYFYY